MHSIMDASFSQPYKQVFFSLLPFKVSSVALANPPIHLHHEATFIQRPIPPKAEPQSESRPETFCRYIVFALGLANRRLRISTVPTKRVMQKKRRELPERLGISPNEATRLGTSSSHHHQTQRRFQTKAKARLDFPLIQQEWRRLHFFSVPSSWEVSTPLLVS